MVLPLKKAAKISKKILKVFGWILLVLVILMIGLLLFIRSPWGQDLIVEKAVSYVSGKTQSEIGIDRLYVTFSGNIYVEGLYLEDQRGDTLLFSESLETGVALLPLIKNGAIHTSKLEWEGLRAHVLREKETGEFNFDFILEAFIAEADSTLSEPAPMDTSASAFPDVDLGPINLEDFELSYRDEVMGIEGYFKLGTLSLDMERMDLEKMNFYIKDFLFSNSEMVYKQTLPFEPTAEEDTAAAVMPLIIIDQMAIKNVKAYYESEPDGMVADVLLGDFLVELPEANLAEQKVVLSTFSLHGSEVVFKRKPQEITHIEETQPNPDAPFNWPEWTIDVDKISLGENRFFYQSGDEAPRPGYFNPEAIDMEDFTFLANNIYMKEEKAGMDLEAFSFKEISGFNLQEMMFSLSLSEQSTQLSNIKLATNRSRLGGDFKMAHSSLEEMLNLRESLQIALEVELDADIRDAYFFSPELEKDSILNTADQQPITADLEVNGTMGLLDLARAEVSWGNATSLHAKGTIGHPLDTGRFFLDSATLDFRSQREDLLLFLDEKNLGVHFPEKILLESAVDGSLNDMAAKAMLQMPEGEVRLEGNFANADQIAFDVDMQVEGLQLGKLLQDEQFGRMSFEIQSKGKGNNLQDLDAVLVSNFKELTYNKADYSGLSLEGEMKDGKGNADLSLQGKDLEMDLHASADLDSISPKYQLTLNLHGADLFALGISGKELRTSLKLEASFEGDAEDFDVNGSISDGMVVYDRRPYALGPVGWTAHVRNDTTSLDLDGDMLHVRLRSNASPSEMGAAVQRHIQRYFDSTSMDTVVRPVEVEMNLALRSAPILEQVFLEGLEQMDSVSMKIDFKEADTLLTANLDLPHILYNDMEVDSLRLRVRADKSDMAAEFGLLSAVAGPLDLGRTFLSADLKKEHFHIDFKSYDEEELLVHLGTNVRKTSDSLFLNFEPGHLVLNREEWTIPEDNRVLVGDDFLRFENFVWKRGNQELSVSHEVEGVEKEHLGIFFRDFRLSTITGFLNPEDTVAGGLLDGEFIIENLFGATGLIADFNIDSLSVLEVPLGTLTLDAKTTGPGGYDFNLALKEGALDLDIVGDYLAAESGAELNLDVALNEILLKGIEEFSGDEIRDAEGSISGNIKVEGTTADPFYEGNLQFNKAVFTVSTLNSRFRLSDESLNVDNSGLYLENFTITDEKNNSFTLNGEVLTTELTNPAFNLALNAENFQLLNSTRDDNELFFGKANISADIDIAGNLDQPRVGGRVKINDETDLTFIVPESQLDIVERDGVVLFVDRENPDDILTKLDEEQTTSELKGLELNAIVEVEPIAVFNVIVDERSGDNLQLGGEADLKVNMDPNGRITLSGRYEVNKGHYEMSLYNLVSRRFEIDKGSTVTWGGDPMNATLDLRAIYHIETSASELMATQVSGADTEVATQFRQELPFLVYLNVQGDLLKPLISFRLDMPEDQRGAIGGNVYTRVQQVNVQEDELNKQVFSLLVLNRFFPATGSDGTGGGTSAMARSSVSQVLSGQLNAFSNSLFGDTGLELDFDLDSFTDYQEGAPQNRTQLNVSAQQRLFNDRLVVQVGSQVDVEGSSNASDRANPIFGNVSLEYLLTENGRYRLRGFRKNQFESIIEGQLIVTGLSLIFNREFNKFWELWKGIDPEDQEIKPDAEKVPSNSDQEDEPEDEENNSSSARKEENQ